MWKYGKTCNQHKWITKSIFSVMIFSPVFQTFQHTWMACVVCRCLARLSPHIACDSCSPWINDSRCSWSENLTPGNTSQHITRPFSLFESAPSTIISSEPFMERSSSYILKASHATPTGPQTNLNFPQICLNMPRNGPKMAKNDPKCPKVAQIWPQMAPNGPKWP